MTQEKSDIERTVLSIAETVRKNAEENSRLLIVGAGLVFVLQLTGIISLGLPSYWPIVGIVIGAGSVAGWMASDRLYSLIPEEEKITLIAFHTADGTGGEIWELHPDEFEDLEVVGSLFEWDEAPTRCYEVRQYDPEQNRAVGNWRESKPGSDLAEQERMNDVIAEIDELRSMLEPEAKKARTMRRQLSGIVRVLDKRRDREYIRSMDNASIDKDTTEANVSDVLEELLDQHAHPQQQTEEESDFEWVGEDKNGEKDPEDFQEILTVDQSESIQQFNEGMHG